MVVKLSPLVHIEIAIPDAEKAYEFLNRIFGAEKTEIEFAKFLSSGGVANVVHVRLSNLILQFVEPLVKEGLWAEHLEKKGPGVNNLTFVVEDMKEAVAALEKEGAEVLLEMPFDWTKLYGKYARTDVAPVHMISGEDTVGFRFELAEMPLKSSQKRGE